MTDNFIFKDDNSATQICGIYPDGGWFINDGLGKKKYKMALNGTLARIAEVQEKNEQQEKIIKRLEEDFNLVKTNLQRANDYIAECAPESPKSKG